MRAYTNASLLAYRGVLIERPCAFCDTTSIHMDNLCQDGPCAICGVKKHVDNWATHPLPADGVWRGSYDAVMHDWTAHEYLPADIDRDLPAFEALVDEARAQGMPERYTSDLFRDYQFIAREPETPFVWVLRPWGTHIVVGYHGWQGALGWLRDNEPEGLVYYWDGERLEPIDWVRAERILNNLSRVEVPA